MKNKFLITILLSLISNSLFAENVSIKSKNIILDKIMKHLFLREM